MHCTVNLFTLALILPGWGAGAVTAAKTSATPLSMPPSQDFDGNDGWWSSFEIQVGTPPQAVRLLPGTSASAGDTTWVVLAEGCWEATIGLPDCPNSRGYTFTRNESKTWSTKGLANGGLYSLETYEEEYLGLTGSANYGYDTVNLGIDGQGLPTLHNQLVAGFATDNYWLGSLGLSPQPLNLSSLDTPIPSMLGALRKRSYVPGSSWAYTAGAAYLSPQVYGSLTFGGYDTTRQDFEQTLSNIAFGANSQRDLVVQLRTITYNTTGSTPLLTEAIYIFIDSMVSQLWLPTEVCKDFEQAFNLTWNANSSLYLIDEDVHDALLAQNPTFTFALGAGTGGPTIDIVLPYAAFDLNVTWPITNGPSRYFPLQRAQNSSQFTLGRVFLQAAYVIADYDRQNFTIAQALFPPTSVKENLVAICAPGNEAACDGHGSVLNTGAIVGIVISLVLLLCLIIVGVVWTIRRRRKRMEQQAAVRPPAYSKDEEAPHSKHLRSTSELDGHEPAKHEMDQSNEFRTELATDEDTGGKSNRHELMHSWTPSEMAAEEVAAVELEAPVG